MKDKINNIQMQSKITSNSEFCSNQLSPNRCTLFALQIDKRYYKYNLFCNLYF